MDEADSARPSLGFFSLRDTAALARKEILIPAPEAVLVSPGVELAAGIVLWPGTVLQCLEDGVIVIGPRTVLFPGTRIVASGGEIRIGAKAEIGEEGGFTIKAEAGERIDIGDGARLLGGGSLTRSNRVGHGAQILGTIRCQNCTLGGGGTYRHPEPDERGGVLKGSGVARGVEVPSGHSIQAFGLFAEAPLHPQSYFHPK